MFLYKPEKKHKPPIHTAKTQPQTVSVVECIIMVTVYKCHFVKYRTLYILKFVCYHMCGGFPP